MTVPLLRRERGLCRAPGVFDKPADHSSADVGEDVILGLGGDVPVRERSEMALCQQK